MEDMRALFIDRSISNTFDFKSLKELIDKIQKFKKLEAIKKHNT